MTHILIPREPNAALLRPFTGCPADELPLAWAAMVRAAEVQNARAGAAPAAVAGPAWDKTRDSLATLLLGLARRSFLDFDVACIALDAATEPGMPLAYMRGALAAPALEAPAAPVPELPGPDLWRDASGLRGYTKDPGQGPWYTAETVRALLAAAPQAPNCTRCSGSGEDPEGYLTHGRGPDDHAVDGPCRSCDGTGSAPQAPADLQAAPVAWMYQRHGSDFGAWFMAAGQEADDLRVGRPNIMVPCPNHYGWTALYAAPQAPAEAQEPAANLHDDGYWTPTKTEAGRALNERLMRAGSPRIPVYTHPTPQQAAPQAPAALDELGKIAAIAACWGCDHPDAPDDTELLRRVKWAARQLRAVSQAPAAPLCEDCGNTGTVYDGKRVSFCQTGCAASVAERRADAAAPAAPAEPVELDIDRVLALADLHADDSREDGVRLLDRGGLVALAQDVLRIFAPEAAPAAPAVDATSDTALLDAMQRHRIALVPEFEGPWDAELYEEGEEPQHIASGATPREALRAALAAQAKEGGAA